MDDWKPISFCEGFPAGAMLFQKMYRSLIFRNMFFCWHDFVVTISATIGTPTIFRIYVSFREGSYNYNQPRDKIEDVLHNHLVWMLETSSKDSKGVLKQYPDTIYQHVSSIILWMIPGPRSISSKTSWWFQPTLNILVQHGIIIATNMTPPLGLPYLQPT